MALNECRKLVFPRKHFLETTSGCARVRLGIVDVPQRRHRKIKVDCLTVPLRNAGLRIDLPVLKARLHTAVNISAETWRQFA